MSESERAVHPSAAVFPMLSDEELADLAEDIEANGLKHPIVLDEDGAIVDGRNRDAACKIAGVEPRYETLPKGTDVRAYILSMNVKRRHMKAGAIAVAVALMYADDDEGERSGSGPLFSYGARAEASTTYGINKQRFSEAALVVRYAPDLAEQVLSGGYALDKAHKDARARKDAATSMEAQISTLRAEAPDLATLVIEERMALREALALLDKRRADERRRNESATASLLSVVRVLAPPSGDIAEHAGKLMKSFDPTLVRGAEGITSPAIERAIAFLEVVLVELDEREEKHGSTEAQPVSS